MGNVAKELAESVEELSEGAPVNVGDLLTLPAFGDVTVVAGESGLDRLVSRVNIMEVPDIVPWVKPHELLLTTGYPLREVPETLARLVCSLDDAGVAAVGVKLRRYLHELPDEMLAEADRRGFPVLLLPDGTAFDDVLNAVLGDVLNRQSTILERSELVHRALVSTVLDGGGLDELVTEISTMVAGVTFVTTSDGRVLAQAGDDEPSGLLDSRDLFETTGRFRSERFAPGLHRVGSDSLAVVSVQAGRADHGRLVVVRRDPPMAEGDLHILERAATVAALVISKSVAVRAVEAKYQGDFVREVLQGRAGPVDSVVSHFATLGWDVSRPVVVVVAAHDPITGADQRSAAEARAAQDRFVNAWVNVVGRHDKTAPVVGFTSEVVAIVGAPEEGSPRQVVDELVRFVSGDGGGGRHSFSTGVSRVVDDPLGLCAGYEQARRAVHVGRQLQGTSAVAHFDDLGAFRLLSLIEDAGELRSFVTEVLGDLADEDAAEAADMRATLRVLLDTNFNVAETSRRLHFHYNTLRYRITKLERMVGPFTTDPDLQLDLSLALRVMQMRNV
ncbi:MAG: PucR family transcriptional regulator [Nocardioidaceae bacterium]